ncbi:hypothetical protein AB8Q34_26715, partial [Klebsiella quasipneumoniae subsp. similipneumoniae]
ENSLSAKVSCWLIRLLILGSGYNTMISHLGLIRTFLRLGAETAYQFLINFDWHNYKKIRRDITSAYQTSLPLTKLNRYFKNK